MLICIVLVSEHHHVLFEATELVHVDGLRPCLHLLLEVDESGVFKMEVCRSFVVLQTLALSGRCFLESQARRAEVDAFAGLSLRSLD